MAVPNVYSQTNSDEVAIEIFESLMEGVDVSLPSVDLNDPKFSFEQKPDDPLYTVIGRLTEADLTSRQVNGSGMFDGLMQAINEHLKQEYKQNRITGSDYAKVYLESTLGVMSNAVQYLLGKDQAYYQGVLAQAQARRAQIEAISALVQLETVKVDLAIAKVKAKTGEAEYALTKHKLATEDAQYALLKTQGDTAVYQLNEMLPNEKQKLILENETVGYQLNEILPIEKNKLVIDNDINQYRLAEILPVEKGKLVTENAVATYQLTEILPIEKDKLTEEREGLVLNNTRLDYENINLLPLQKDKLTQENQGLVYTNTRLNYENTNILPENLAKLMAETVLVNTQNSKLTADKDGVVYTNQYLLPATRLNTEADTNIKTYQATQLLPAQKENTASDTLIKEYTRTNLLPAQLLLTKEQAEAKRGETLNTRTDGAVIVGTIGKQKDLYTQQITSYQRDAETKAAKMFLDTWIVQKQIDEGLAPFTSIQNPSLDDIMGKIKVNNGLT